MDDLHVMTPTREALSSVERSLVDSALTFSSTGSLFSILPTNPIHTCTGKCLPFLACAGGVPVD